MMMMVMMVMVVMMMMMMMMMMIANKFERVKRRSKSANARELVGAGLRASRSLVV